MKMEKIAYTILSIIALAFFICMLAGLIAAFPYGIVGLLLIIAFGLLFIKVLKDRLSSKEDDYYSKKVEK